MKTRPVAVSLIIVKLVLICLILSVAIYVLYHVHFRDITPVKIRNYVQSFGVAGPLIFVVLYAFRPLVLFPANVFSIASGLAFGTLLGWICNYVGAILSAMTAYWTGRFLGRDLVERILGKRLAQIDELVEQKGFTVVFYLRFFSPFDLLSYACGLSGISFGRYMIATAIPIIPGTLAFSYFGSSFTKIDNRHDLLHAQFLIPAALLAVTLVLPIFLKKLLARKDRNI